MYFPRFCTHILQYLHAAYFEVYLDILLQLPTPALFDVRQLGVHFHA